MVVYKIITFSKYPYKHPHTLYLLLIWPVLHGLVAFMGMVSEVAIIHGSHLKCWAHVQNEGLTFETTGPHVK